VMKAKLKFMERRRNSEERSVSGERRRSEDRRRFPEGSFNPDGPRRRITDEEFVSCGPLRRFPVANGIFYPDSREALISQIVSWGLKESYGAPGFGGQVIIAPHGAWSISGKIAAAAFAALQTGGQKVDEPETDGISRVIILGPCHSPGEQGIYLSESVSFQTPLGDLPVDRGVNRKLASCSTLIRENDIFHLSEHSLEILLPMVKYCFPYARIVPILACGSRPVLISGLARALAAILENYMEKTLLVISTNISVSSDPALAFSMADEFRSILLSMDTGAFLARLSGGHISACGGALVAALLESGLLAGKRFTSLTPLSHGTEENGHIVYYGAFAAMREN